MPMPKPRSQQVIDSSAKPAPSARWVAVVGAAAALLGAGIGGGSSYLVATRTDADAAQLADLAVRRDAYARYYGDIADYISTIESSTPLAQKALRAKNTGEPELKIIRAELAKATATMFRDQAEVVLLGTQSVADAAFALNGSVAHARDLFTSATLAADDIEPALTSIANRLGEFAAAAKKDLGRDE